jgi:hypothetical protein
MPRSKNVAMIRAAVRAANGLGVVEGRLEPEA